MNSTDPRPNANGGFRSGRMLSTRNRPANAAGNRNNDNDGTVAPLNIRGRAAGSAGATSSSYAYTFSGPRNSTRPGRIASTADSNYRYEYYRDYLSNPATPVENDWGNRHSGGGGSGSNGGGGGGGNNGNGGNGRGDNNDDNNNGNNGGRFQHNISFSFSIGGSTAASTPDVSFGSFGLGGGNGSGGVFGGLPVSLPVFGSGFPFGQGGRSNDRGGFIPTFPRF